MININNFTKIIVVTHGGFIMELLNVINKKNKGAPPSLKNIALNCCLYTIEIYCRNTGIFCNE